MNLLSKKGFYPYYKTRIIITFCIVTVIIVVILSRTGYLFIRNIYLNQLAEQAKIVTSMIARQVDPAYLNMLEFGNPTESTHQYFSELLGRNIEPGLHSEIFIFDKAYNVIVHSDTSVTAGIQEPRLLLNTKEINDLPINSGTASLPFKGNDDKWYLWGFYKLSNTYWLAVRQSAVRFNEVDALSSLFWYIGLAGVILSLAAALFTANAITKPLNKLIAFSRSIGTGDFTTKAPENMHGEIKMLSDAMDGMKINLADSQKEKETMLAQIAHEIRNPLGGILLLVNLVKENLSNFEKNNEYLDKIIKEVNGLKELITSFLNFSRPVPVNPGWVDVNKIITDIENIFNVTVKEKNIVIKKNIQLEKIYFDEGHLKQILVNLMSNSVESAQNCTAITITANSSPKWEIIFNDNGSGINGEAFDKIFNPFFTTRKNGTGLGLAICRKLSQENNAELHAVKNTHGATFILTKDIVYEN